MRAISWITAEFVFSVTQEKLKEIKKISDAPFVNLRRR